MQYEKSYAAFAAAERIINMVEWAGYDLSAPQSIIDFMNYSTMPKEMHYGYGASRLVIWDDECDFVIKVALTKDCEKYCQHEVEIYEAAVEEGLSDNFAWCMCYSEPAYWENEYVPGIYVMEYADCDEEAVSDSAWKHGYEVYCQCKGYDSSSYEYADEYNDWNWTEADDMVLEYIESTLTPEVRRMFEIFVVKWAITDIHNANAGFIGNKLVITDYSGWNW